MEFSDKKLIGRNTDKKTVMLLNTAVGRHCAIGKVWIALVNNWQRGILKFFNSGHPQVLIKYEE
jgi:hypothetical protein